MKYLLTLGVLICCLVGCSQSEPTGQTQTTAPTPSTAGPTTAIITPPYVSDEKAAEAEYNRRAPIKKEFLAAAKKLVVAGKSQPHADIYNFIVEHGMLALPIPGNCMPVEKEPVDSFAIVVVLPEDAKLGQPWDGILAKIGAAASYSADLKTMILSKPLAGSDEGMGMTLLHEGYHAYQAWKFGAKPDSPEAFCRGEVETHEFIAQLTIKLHPQINDLVETAAAMIQSTDSSGAIIVTSEGAIHRFIDSKLDEAYGRPISNSSERAALENDTFYLANFRSIDHRKPPGGLAAKTAFLKGWLEKTNQAQWRH